MDPDAGDPASPTGDGAAPADPFAALGLPRAFGTDAATVERAYLMKAASLHPDLGGPDPNAAAEAARAMAELNAARSSLLNAEARANAIASLRGVPSASECRDLPDGFLFEILETRMAIEAAAESGDAEEVKRWRTWVQEERTRYGGEFEDLIATETDDETALRAVREHLNAWRYIERLAAQLPESGKNTDSGDRGARGAG